MSRITLDRTLLILALALAVLALGTFTAAFLQGRGGLGALGARLDTGQTDAGAELFRNLGCVTCHVHRGVEGKTGVLALEGVPDLTDYRGDPQFLRRWLANPSAVRPGTEMPRLDLSDEEIEALVTFLSAP